jgi:hypothetical protein
MKLIKLEVLTYAVEQGPKIDYAALNLPEPEEERELSWQYRYFNLKVLEDELSMIYSEVEEQTVFRFYDDRTIIVKGDVEEVLKLLI